MCRLFKDYDFNGNASNSCQKMIICFPKPQNKLWVSTFSFSLIILACANRIFCLLVAPYAFVSFCFRYLLVSIAAKFLVSFHFCPLLVWYLKSFRLWWNTNHSIHVGLRNYSKFHIFLELINTVYMLLLKSYFLLSFIPFYINCEFTWL